MTVQTKPGSRLYLRMWLIQNIRAQEMFWKLFTFHGQKKKKLDWAVETKSSKKLFPNCRTLCSEGGKFSKVPERLQKLTQDLLLWREQELSHHSEYAVLKPTWTSNFRVISLSRRDFSLIKSSLITSYKKRWHLELWSLNCPPECWPPLRDQIRPFDLLLPPAQLPPHLQVSWS